MTIHEAIKNRDIEGVVQALHNDPSCVNSRNEQGWTPLSSASSHYFFSAIPLLIKAGAIIDDTSKSILEASGDVTHLDIAEAEAAVAVTKMLLEAGADPNRRHFLHIVAQSYQNSVPVADRIASLLLEYGADPNATEREQYADEPVAFLTPLDRAYQSCNRMVARRLVQAGGHLAYRVDETKGAVQNCLAVILGDGNHLDYLSPEEVNMPDWLGQTPLHVAATVGDHDLVQLLLARGANVHARTKPYGPYDTYFPDIGTTALHLARFRGHPAVVAALLDAGASVMDYATRSSYSPPLVEAVVGATQNRRSKVEAFETIQVLIQHGADVRERRSKFLYPADESDFLEDYPEPGEDEDDSWIPYTALESAIMFGSLPVVKLLLEKGAIVTEEEWL